MGVGLERTPDDVAFLALALKASKVFPVAGALIEPTIPRGFRLIKKQRI